MKTFPDEWPKTQEAVAKIIAENGLLRSLIVDLTDPDTCSLDHSGNCQAHGWFGEDKCPHARAKEVLS